MCARYTELVDAGFWAEQWYQTPSLQPIRVPTPVSQLRTWFSACLPGLSGYTRLSTTGNHHPEHRASGLRAVAMSGTGNGDSFLRTNAVRTAAAITRYSNRTQGAHPITLQTAVTAVAGPNGQLQQSAGDRWRRTGEGEGGIIGIELVNGRGTVVFDFNCGGMFRAWIDDHGQERFEVFPADEAKSIE